LRWYYWLAAENGLLGVIRTLRGRVKSCFGSKKKKKRKTTEINLKIQICRPKWVGRLVMIDKFEIFITNHNFPVLFSENFATNWIIYLCNSLSKRQTFPSVLAKDLAFGS
jgi:hypothetical protein